MRRCKRGGERRLTEDQKALAEAHWDDAQKFACKHWKKLGRPRGVEWSSLADEALMDAALNYRKGTGATFTTYLGRAVWGHFWNSVRVATQARRTYKGSQTREADIGCPLVAALLMRSIPADEDPVGWGLDYEETVYEAARGLKPKQAAAVRLYCLWADTATMKAVGAEMGLTESSISQYISGAAEHISGAA